MVTTQRKGRDLPASPRYHVEGPKAVDFVQTCVSEGVSDLQGIYDYASSFFKIDVPFIIGGSAS